MLSDWLDKHADSVTRDSESEMFKALWTAVAHRMDTRPRDTSDLMAAVNAAGYEGTYDRYRGAWRLDRVGPR